MKNAASKLSVVSEYPEISEEKLIEIVTELELEGAVDQISTLFPSSEINSSNRHLYLTVTPELAKVLITDQFMPSFQRDVNRDNKLQYVNDIKNGHFDIL